MSSSPKFSAPRGLLKWLILEILARHPASGTEIIQEISAKTSGEWRPSPGSIYYIVDRLESHGLITKLPRTGRGLIPYVLASKGRKELTLMKAQQRMTLLRQVTLLDLLSKVDQEALSKTVVDLLRFSVQHKGDPHVEEVLKRCLAELSRLQRE